MHRAGGRNIIPQKRTYKAGNRIALKKKKIKAEQNSAEKDTVKRDNIPRKCQERKLAQGCTRKEQRKSAGGKLAGFCDTQFMPRVGDIIQRRIFHRKWEQNLHISDFFCIFAAGKKKNGQMGVAEVKDSKEMCL